MSEMKVYKMRMIMGKTPNYDASGKLKNTVVTSKFAGEKELSDLLTDDAYKALGCCEISCVGCCDSGNGKIEFPERISEVNNSIKVVKQRAKSKIELLQDENKQLKAESELVMTRLEALESNRKSDYRIELEDKANELGIKFRANIGDAKLEEKIKDVN